MTCKPGNPSSSNRGSLHWLALLLCTWTGTVSANPTACTQGEVSRTVEIVYAEPGQAVPCEVIYAKPAAGTIELLWQAMNKAGYCEEQADNLIEKLEGLGWQCTSQGAQPRSEPELAH
jgi:hypothetical protein